MITREKATEEKDLPHQFFGLDHLCQKCEGTSDDERHLAWERAVIEREQASDTIIREFGS